LRRETNAVVLSLLVAAVSLPGVSAWAQFDVYTGKERSSDAAASSPAKRQPSDAAPTTTPSEAGSPQEQASRVLSAVQGAVAVAAKGDGKSATYRKEISQALRRSREGVDLIGRSIPGPDRSEEGRGDVNRAPTFRQSVPTRTDE
jgi:hypothetical protein